MGWTLRIGVCGVSLAMYAVVTGCAKEETTPMIFVSHADHDHDHAAHSHEHGHDHDLCDEHSHSATGPHGGELIELGSGDYHAELLHNDTSHTVAIYLLDGRAERDVTSLEHELIVNLVLEGKPVQFVLPSVLDKDQSTVHSHYELTDERLCESLDSPKIRGRFSVNIAGKNFIGKIEPPHHDHDGPIY